MSSKSETFSPPPSLAQHFEPENDYIGHFGWLCGYSADALFLNDAVERFTRLIRSQRAQQGRIALAVLLDPGNPQIPFQDAPGVAHFPIIDFANKPFQLLHAKVAVLGFRHQENRSQWQVRLLVSTGNWTRQTLEESLDLAWRIDITSESLIHLDADVQQNCADLKGAWDLLEWVHKLFDTRLLHTFVNGHPNETMNALQQVREWIGTCSKNAKGEQRFFDNRGKSLLFQLPKKIKVNGIVSRNYLAMGSGFYEDSADKSSPPKVPLDIVRSLQNEGLLTMKPEVDLYVNPMACQAIANSVQSLQEHGITTRSAITEQILFGKGAQRTLHAKFLFSANYRENSSICNSAWVYLGSGNLTHPGFSYKMGASAGNLEAGVVFAPDSLHWKKIKTNQEHQVVTNLLPIQWIDEIGDAASLFGGSGMVVRDVIYVAPPIAWLVWYEADGVRELRTEEPEATDVQVLDSVGVACLRTKTGFQWCEAQPRQVCIQWQANNLPFESLIPVVDQYGRIAATKLEKLDIDAAWWQLADFPLPPDEGEDDDGYAGGNENIGKDKANVRSVQMTSYPIRQMMELIESIAAKQTQIDEMDWVLWCNRLEQTLGQASESAPVRYFRDDLKLNPLSPLRHHSFRPLYAETSISELGKLYDDTLCRLEVSWKVNEYSSFGGMK